MPLKLSKQDLKDEVSGARQYAEQFHDNSDEFERLMENTLPADLLDTDIPVNDGSLQALGLELAMRLYQQMHTGTVNAQGLPEWMSAAMTVLWGKYIIPNARSQSSFFVKIFNTIVNSVFLGFQPLYTYYTNRPDYSGGDFTLPYWRDVYPEVGKGSFNDSATKYMDQYYTKSMLRQLINSLETDQKASKKLEVAAPGWNPDKLKKLYDNFHGSDKPQKAKDPTERQNRKHADYVTITRVFQEGFGSDFFAFSSDIAEAKGSEDDGTLGAWVNNNPTGQTPITGMYFLENLRNPFGKGLCELAGHIQNILDELVRTDIKATKLGVDAPIKVSGDTTNTNFNSIVFGPGELWETGDAIVDAVKLSTDAYTQFPTHYGLYKTILLNIVGLTDNTVSATSGDPTFSKTDRGVAAQQERTNVKDNFRGKSVDGSLSDLAENLIYATVMNAQVDKSLPLIAEDIEKLAQAGMVDDNGQPISTNSIEYVWEQLRGDPEEPNRYCYEIDPNSSQTEQKEQSDEALKDFVNSWALNPLYAQAMAASGERVDLAEISRNYLSDKVPNVKKVIVPVAVPGAQAGATAGAPDPGTPPGAAPQPGMPANDPQMEMQQIMQQYGIDQNTAMTFMQARQGGMSDDQIIQYLQQGAPA